MKYMMFSRLFPKGHPRAGERTQFPEKILENVLKLIPLREGVIFLWNYYGFRQDWCQVMDITEEVDANLFKGHTIRPGNRWKVGDEFSPRVWSGLPYRSKQVEFCRPIKVVATFDIFIQYTDRKESLAIWLNNNLVQLIPLEYFHNIPLRIPQNDGLSPADWLAWFPNDFKGQVICWDPDIAADYKRLIKT